MSEYWSGIIVGVCMAVVFFTVCLFFFAAKLDSLESDFKDLQAEHNQLAEWVESNETIMKTYEFFNTHIKELLEEKKNDSTD